MNILLNYHYANLLHFWLRNHQTICFFCGRPVHLDAHLRAVNDLSIRSNLVVAGSSYSVVKSLAGHLLIGWRRLFTLSQRPRGSLKDGKVNQTTKDEVVSALLRTVTRSSLTAPTAKVSIRCSETTFISFPLLKYRKLLIDLLIPNFF